MNLALAAAPTDHPTQPPQPQELAWREGLQRESPAEVTRVLPEMGVPIWGDQNCSNTQKSPQERLISSPALLKLGLLFHGWHFQLSQHEAEELVWFEGS